MGVPRDLLPPAARLAACSAAEAPAAPVGGGEAALAELETREGPVRYAAYAGRTAQLIRMAERVSSIRHLAYASDVGEAFRPTVPKWMVNGTYAIAVGYVAADVAHQTAKAHRAGAPPEEVQRVAAQTATFQLLASILAPFAVIHTSVGLAKKALATAPAVLARHGPTAIGLACIPLLPLVDHPIEHAVEAAFDGAWPRVGGAAAEDKKHA